MRTWGFLDAINHKDSWIVDMQKNKGHFDRMTEKMSKRQRPCRLSQPKTLYLKPERQIAVMVVDIFGNDGVAVAEVDK